MELLHRFSIDLAFVGKVSMQLCCEEKIRIVRNTFQPRFCGLLRWRPVKSIVNFNAIDESAYIFKLVDSRLGIHSPFPTRIRPACYSYINLTLHVYHRILVPAKAGILVWEPYLSPCRRSFSRHFTTYTTIHIFPLRTKPTNKSLSPSSVPFLIFSLLSYTSTLHAPEKP